jgi:UDP-3-O-[3-hydroxymyristoyl] N-acetylglucosamine deacetylase/3-hydroxyacyl-[acyl-carrier-protein] dehydratase
MLRQQRTLAREVALEGVGLHTGDRVSIRVKPAPANHGIRFLRADLDEPVTIEASIANVPQEFSVIRNTTLVKGEFQIHTVEHLLAAASGLHLDNLLIEIEGKEPPEPPDGSCAKFVEAFREVGYVNQGLPAPAFEVTRPISYRSGEVELHAYPHDGFRVTFTIDFQNPHIGRQTATFDLNPDVFQREIAPARTFVLYEDVDRLRSMGLIKGGTLENSIVVGRDGIMNEEPVRFPDEFVRHKILDLVGDLALLGVPLRGHVVASRSGHEGNIGFVRELHRALSVRRTIQNFQPEYWDIQHILDIMPHRYPVLLVDRILELEDKKRVVGMKNVTMNEHFFTGHFPGRPVMPAVLIIEAMAQVGGVLLLSSVENPESHLVYFMSIDKARFRKPVVPGDQIRFELEMVRLKRNSCKMTGKATVDGEMVASAELLSAIVDK